LRPETAQNIFLNFQNIVHAFSPKLPFGIAQFGKAFRNEISPRNFLFRLREFSQFELEYFYDASQKQNLKLSNPNKQIKILTKEMQAKKQNETKQKISELLKSTTPLHASVLENSVIWLETLGINLENVRLRQNLDSERAHYSKDTWEIEYIFPFGWKEIVGVADRGNYDLSNHSKFSGKDLSILNEETGKKIVPSVIEPSFGLERLILAIMFDAYRKETKKVKRETGTVTEERVFLSLNKKLFPKAGIFPLVRKDGLDKKAQQIYKMLKSKLPQISFFISEKQSIGKRYAREDEIGTPFCITVDYETMKGKTKDTVTIRWRDTTRQKRIKIKDLEKFFRKELL
jgi:glycyl-tRNA synthetase